MNGDQGTGGQGNNRMGEAAVRVDLDAVRADVAQLKQDLVVLAEDLGSVAKDRAQRARERVEERLTDLKDRTSSAAHSARVRGKYAVRQVEHTVEEHPLASVGIAFGVGLLVGALLSRR